MSLTIRWPGSHWDKFQEEDVCQERRAGGGRSKDLGGQYRLESSISPGCLTLGKSLIYSEPPFPESRNHTETRGEGKFLVTPE